MTWSGKLLLLYYGNLKPVHTYSYVQKPQWKLETGIMYYYVELVSRPIGCHGNFISCIYLSTT